MTTINWAGASGDWKAGATWSGGHAPGASDYAVIGGTTFGTISVTSADLASKVTLDDANATVAIAAGGTLTVGTAFNLRAGTLQVVGAQALTNMTLNIGSTAGAAVLASADVAGLGVDLTLGAKLTIVQAGHAAKVQTAANANDTITNLGGITAAYAGVGAYFEITGQGAFINQGAISVANGETLIVTPNVFANPAGGEIDLNAATLDLRTDLTTADLGKVVNTNGVVRLDGALDNTGAVLSVGTGSSLGALTLESSGVISGGVIADGGAGVTLHGGQFHGVTYDGTLDLSQPNAYLRASGLVLKAKSGTGPGAVNLTGYRADLSLIGQQTLDNAVVDIGADGVGSTPILYFYDSGGRSLTLGAGLVINQTGAYADLETAPGDTTVNLGAINATDTHAGATFRIFGGGHFSNAGTLAAGGGDTLEIQSAFLNLAGGQLSGGTIEADAGSTVELPTDSVVAVDAAALILSGAGSAIQSRSSATASEVGVESQLGSIAGAGVLELLAGRGWTSSLTVVNAGQLVLGGGAFSPAALVNAGGVSGSGSISSSIVNSGTLTASGGALSLSGGLTNRGLLAGSGVLAFTGGVASLGAGTQLTAAEIGQSGGAQINVGAAGLAYGGIWTQSAGTLFVPSGKTFTLTGVGNLFAGTLSGAGTLSITAGSDRLAGAELAIAHVAIGAATVTLAGTITNGGAVAVGTAHLLIDAGGATLTGDGQLVLLNLASNRVSGVATGATLTNANGQIRGAGQLGGGHMRLVNQKSGRIIGNVSHALIIDTGALNVVNAGTITAENGGGVEIRSPVGNTGVLAASGGTLTLDGAVTGAGVARIFAGGVIAALGAFKETVNFLGATGTLRLANSVSYTGKINRFSKSGGTTLDLLDIAFVSGVAKATYQDNGLKTGGVLTVTDGVHTAHINLIGDYSASTFTVADDGAHHALVSDPAAPPAPAPSRAFVQAMASFAGPVAAHATSPRLARETLAGSLFTPHAARS